MILVTGGAGYIGSHANKLLNKTGYKTVVFDNLSRGHREFVKWGEFFRGDLKDEAEVRQCFKKYPIEAVMHFGALAYVGESITNPAKYYRNNIISAINLLDVMKDFEAKYFIFSSSCATYGVPKEMPIIEDNPQRPVNPYGRSKLMIEEILRDYDKAYGIKYINLRYFNAAGADIEGEIGEWHDPETHLIPLAIYAALGKNDCVKVFGSDYPTDDGTCVRDYVHVTDLADAHIKALRCLQETNKSDSFNLGNEMGYSVKEVIEAVRRVTKKDIKVIGEKRREGDPPVLVSSSRKAKDMLGWRPMFKEIDALIETAWKWHKAGR
jgi:UDP-glucose 4-epimerase